MEGEFVSINNKIVKCEGKGRWGDIDNVRGKGRMVAGFEPLGKLLPLC